VRPKPAKTANSARKCAAPRPPSRPPSQIATLPASNRHSCNIRARGHGDGPCRGSDSPGRREAGSKRGRAAGREWGNEGGPDTRRRPCGAPVASVPPPDTEAAWGRQEDGPVPPTPAGTGVAAGKMPWRSRRDRARLRAWTGDRGTGRARGPCRRTKAPRAVAQGDGEALDGARYPLLQGWSGAGLQRGLTARRLRARDREQASTLPSRTDIGGSPSRHRRYGNSRPR